MKENTETIINSNSSKVVIPEPSEKEEVKNVSETLTAPIESMVKLPPDNLSKATSPVVQS